jgi:hypothetical protein
VSACVSGVGGRGGESVGGSSSTVASAWIIDAAKEFDLDLGFGSGAADGPAMIACSTEGSPTT